jgi:hypothetical protein
MPISDSDTGSGKAPDQTDTAIDSILSGQKSQPDSAYPPLPFVFYIPLILPAFPG